MSIQWTNRLELGHPRIDSEHRIFLRLINEFGERVERGARADELMRTLREIRKYADFHFVSEENLMEEMKYPGTDAHRQLHAELLSTLDQRMLDLVHGSLQPSDLVGQLEDWFAEHTVQEDMKLVGHIDAIGGSRLAMYNPFF